MLEITILPAQGCRRSRKILDYLEQNTIPFTRIDLESDEGQALAERYSLRASPGILVDGQSINPFDLLLQPQRRAAFGIEHTTIQIECATCGQGRPVLLSVAAPASD